MTKGYALLTIIRSIVCKIFKYLAVVPLFLIYLLLWLLIALAIPFIFVYVILETIFRSKNAPFSNIRHSYRDEK